jgi:hypothetical protein
VCTWGDEQGVCACGEERTLLVPAAACSVRHCHAPVASCLMLRALTLNTLVCLCVCVPMPARASCGMLGASLPRSGRLLPHPACSHMVYLCVCVSARA